MVSNYINTINNFASKGYFKSNDIYGIFKFGSWVLPLAGN